MDNPTGTIRALVADPQGTRAVVEVDVAVACPRCATGKGCGAGLFGGEQRLRRVDVVLDDSLQLAEGDSVEISLPPANLLRAALFVYGLPLGGAVTAAGLAYLLSLGDSGAALAALMGLVAGLLLSRWQIQRVACIDELVPRVEKRLQHAPPGI